MPLCIGLLLLFITDSVYSLKHPNEGKGITDYVSTLSITDLHHTEWLPPAAYSALDVCLSSNM